MKCKCGKEYDVILDYMIEGIHPEIKGMCLYCLSEHLTESQMDHVLSMIKDDSIKCDGGCCECVKSFCP